MPSHALLATPAELGLIATPTHDAAVGGDGMPLR
jgi:hypothetical protein